MSHEPTRLMACERARGGQYISVAVHRGSPRERRTEKLRKILFRLGIRVAFGLTPLTPAARPEPEPAARTARRNVSHFPPLALAPPGGGRRGMVMPDGLIPGADGIT